MATPNDRSDTAQVGDGRSAGFQIVWEGLLADQGEVPAAELGAALQGVDRLLQLAFYSYHSSDLVLPRPGTSIYVELRVRRVHRGSLVVDGYIELGSGIAIGVLGNVAHELLKKGFKWAGTLVREHIKAKRRRETLDGMVERLETAAKAEGIRPSIDREASEDFASSLETALDNATVPLDSSAAKQLLSMRGADLDITIDQSGRMAIKRAFEPPSLDPDAEEVIEAPVKFVRINKKTGYGLMTFPRGKDPSQFGQQRFHCDDKSIRRRANPYTGSFHTDEALMVRMQRKNYATDRRGHYWLILGTAAAATSAEKGLFSGATDGGSVKQPQRKQQKRTRKRK